MLVLRFIIGLIAADFRCKVQGEVKWPDETAKSKLRQGAERGRKREREKKIHRMVHGADERERERERRKRERDCRQRVKLESKYD